jgi:peptide/nickel transport system permease protein
MSSSYIISRLGQMAIVMFIVATLVFFIFRVVPGDPAAVTLGMNVTEEAREAVRAEMGLDRPLLEQYSAWLWGVVRGDFGTAFTYGGITVRSLVFPALLRTLELAAASIMLALAISLPLGLLAAHREGTWIDHLARAVAITGFSMPSFWLGLLMLLLFSTTLGWLPPGGHTDLLTDPVDHVRRLIMPAATTALVLSGIFVRFARTSLVAALTEDYVRTARAKGVAERHVLLRHALKNASIPLVTVVGVYFGALIGGLVVIESVFSWPGLGLLMVQSTLGRSYEVVQAAVLVSAAAFVLINTGVDLLYAWLDPRIADA